MNLLKQSLVTPLCAAAILSSHYQLTGVSLKDLLPQNLDLALIDKAEAAPNDTIPQQWLTGQQLMKSYSPNTRISAVQIKKPLVLEDTLNLSELKKVRVLATGYTAGPESTGKTPAHPAYGITSSGVQVKRDLYSTIAADTNIFPFGTILYIPDYGFGVVADRGSAIVNKRLDLYFETVPDVYEEWGKRSLDVYIVKEGNGKLTSKMLRELNEDEAVQVFRSQYTQK